MKTEDEMKQRVNDLVYQHATGNAKLKEMNDIGHKYIAEYVAQIILEREAEMLEWVLDSDWCLCGHCGGKQYLVGSPKKWTCLTCGG